MPMGPAAVDLLTPSTGKSLSVLLIVAHVWFAQHVPVCLFLRKTTLWLHIRGVSASVKSVMRTLFDTGTNKDWR
jgi:hypothetical protein